MKIGSTQPTDLLQRMREAARTDGAGPLDQAGTATGGAAPAAPGAAEPTTLQQKLAATAQRALQGEFATPAELRSEVVEQIVHDRWADQVGRADLRRMSEELKVTLTDDPEFSRQVDEMLILAARTLRSE